MNRREKRSEDEEKGDSGLSTLLLVGAGLGLAGLIGGLACSTSSSKEK